MKENKDLYCETCNYTATRSDNYKRHLNSFRHKQRLGLIPWARLNYHCEKCDLTTKDKSNFKRHLKIHYTDEDKLYPDHKYIVNGLTLWKEINKMILLYNEHNIDAAERFNFYYYYDNYTSLSMEEKNNFLIELKNEFN
jgi:hypothetical protein